MRDEKRERVVVVALLQQVCGSGAGQTRGRDGGLAILELRSREGEGQLSPKKRELKDLAFSEGGTGEESNDERKNCKREGGTERVFRKGWKSDPKRN